MNRIAHNKYPASVFSLIFNDEGKVLFASRDSKTKWTAIGGWMEQETVVECINREIREELGEINFQIIDIVDAHMWNYQDNMPIISIFALVKHISGIPVAKDDIEGFALKWFKLDELGGIDIDCPRQPEIIHKTLFLMEEYTKHSEADFLKYKWRLLS